MARKKLWLVSAIAALTVAVVIVFIVMNQPDTVEQAIEHNGVDEIGEAISDEVGDEANTDTMFDADADGVKDEKGEVMERPKPITAPEPKRTQAEESEPEQLTIEYDIPSLAEVFAEYFPIGIAIETPQTYGVPAELLKKHANMLVAGNEMKPDAIQPREGNFTFNRADRIVEFAKENNMALRFHTLVWHNQVPRWFFIDPDGRPMVDETDPEKREANKKLLLERLETHVRTVVERYKDDIKSWDVVNEVIEPGDPGGLRNSEWYQITGTEYIETAFRVAREVGGPDIKLYINDYSTEDARKRDILYELVKEMLDKGVPIDGVGHQTHINVYYPPINQIIASAQKFAELGLDNIITELDMSIYEWNDRSDYGRDIPEALLLRQAKRYEELFNALREHKGLFSEVVFWGVSDAHTWLHTFPVRSRTDAPMPFDKQYQAKPAFWGIVDPSKLPQS